MEENTKDIALIDGDLLFHSIAAAAEYGNDPDDVDLEEVYHSMEVRASNVMIDAGCTHRRIFLTKSNFRYWIAGDYKANRKDSWRPECLKHVMNYAEMFMGAETFQGLEADDLLAINQKENTVICTIDKDLQQIDGRHYRWAYLGKESESFTVTEGWRKFYVQLLIGDATDGIIGCGVKKTLIYKSGAKVGQEYQRRSGVGEKAAEQLIATCSSEAQALDVCMKEYGKVFGDKALGKLIQQARLLHMIREMDGDYAKMWTPFDTNAEWLNVKTGVWLDG